MKLIFETDDKFDESKRVQRVTLEAQKFVDEQFLAGLGRILEEGGGKLIAVGRDTVASVKFDVRRVQRRRKK